MNNKPLVSIIMPVYNTQKYLCEAIESVIAQSYDNWELLTVDDNSTDKSKEICKEYAEKDNRIIFLENNTENHGPGATRNIGLDNANGEFIYFMDADDWIENDLLECCINRIYDTNADVVQIGVIYERENEKKSIRYHWSGKETLTKEDIKNCFFDFWSNSRYSLWLYFLKAEKVKTLRFENMTIGEDISFILDILSEADKIAYIQKELYHYRFVAGSTSHSWVEKTLEYRSMIWQHQKKFLKSVFEQTDNFAYSEAAYDNYIWAIYHLSSNLCPLSYKEKKKQLSGLNQSMDFERYRSLYPLNRQHGINRFKYFLVKHRLENVMLMFGSWFLKVFRGE